MKIFDVPAHVLSNENDNITDLLADRVKATPDLALFAIEDKEGTWNDVTARQFESEVIALAKGLVASGIQPGDAVAIMAHTSYAWTLIDFAIWYAGGIGVAIYETSAPAQVEWILSNSESVALWVESADQEARFEEIRRNTPTVKQVWRIDRGDAERLMKDGKEIADVEIEKRRHLANLSDISTLIYTSGTTGLPKGCELTHRGFVELSRNAAIELPQVLHEGASTLMFLPLAHVFARFISVIAIHAGVKVGHQPDARNVAPAMQSFHPNWLLAVPRVFEKVYNSAEQKAESGGKGKIFRKAASVAVSWSKANEAGKVGLGLAIQHKLFDVLVYSKLREAMGGRVEYAVSGGGPLGARLAHFYRAIGLTVLEGYGMTETTAPATIGRVGKIKIGKVGQPLPGTGVAIADDGEILMRGFNILRGYWKNEKATKETIIDGWLHSGDIGELDDDGYLKITGRKKELIITAGGKNVAPAPLEDPLRANPLIAQAVVIGDNQPFIAALISLDAEMLPIWLANNGGDTSMSLAEASKSAIVINEVQRAIDQVNKSVSKAESIRKFEIISTELSEDSGHVTPSLKIKRAQVMKDFAPIIDDIYGVPPRTVDGMQTV
jgi:long-chain acyl-CoA synthetase